ncbi:MAG: hypothetical protein AMS18_16315, partial [Gemmatimonas sp. SG8_17]
LYPAATGIADTLEVVRHRQPEWSDDGRLSFGLRPKQPDDEAEKDSIAATDSTAAPDSAGAAKQDDDVELPGVQIWHSSDVRTIPMQRASAGRDAQRTLLAVWDPDRNGVVQIATGLFVPRHLTAICTDVLRDIV